MHTTLQRLRTQHPEAPVPLILIGAGGIALLLFILIVWIAVRDDPAVQKMAGVLERDQKLGQQLAQRIEGGVDPVDAIRQTVQEMRQIDLKGCPEDFRVAYVRHINAWDGLLLERAKLPKSVVGQMWLGFTNSLSGELDGGSRRYADAVQRRMDEVQATWAEVTTVAAKHEVQVPRR